MSHPTSTATPEHTHLALAHFLFLDAKQFDKLADICADIGTVIFASVVLPAVLDVPDRILIFTGMESAVVFWLLSLWLIKHRSTS